MQAIWGHLKTSPQKTHRGAFLRSRNLCGYLSFPRKRESRVLILREHQCVKGDNHCKATTILRGISYFSIVCSLHPFQNAPGGRVLADRILCGRVFYLCLGEKICLCNLYQPYGLSIALLLSLLTANAVFRRGLGG